MLGSGTFGRVTLVQNKKTKAVYALKAMLKSEIVAQKQQNNVLNEKEIMINSNHPFILRLFQTFKDSKKLFMLLEFVQGGELFTILHTSTSDGVPDHQAKFYSSGILLALGYLHTKDVAYRDMKPENCLIDKFGYPKLIDFGFAKVITSKSFTLCGTPEYLAPELVLAKGHNKAVDYWALGVCFCYYYNV
jgi:serine/threonine protein kinase